MAPVDTPPAVITMADARAAEKMPFWPRLSTDKDCCVLMAAACEVHIESDSLQAHINDSTPLLKNMSQYMYMAVATFMQNA